ncbi:MBL fold metallo-hydrolase [Natranaeroarchaeum aerophilus]|uniref:MBL fold metallo-hydrolase n=1 Tax=Natranaeroarchaeum aerophilus TaxID=2917711 RepID=A0AAE3K6B8_9EURY|nr:MBL fold metallo-hydrolase [Natranaeroarchaeum aerophilus]MCL9814766.1 MBL fold metallo-hydrolase [Natranaeroarchaeum aerophilus]
MTPVRRVPIDLDARIPTGSANAYVVGRHDGVLVDPARRTDALDEAVENCTPAKLLVTHTHPDHVGAVAEYATEYDLTVLARAGYERRFERTTGIAPEETVRDGALIDAGTHTLRAIATPGHAPDHLALDVLCDSGRGLLVGDLAVAEGSVFVGGQDGDMRGYLTALRRLLARDPDRLYPGHGPVIEEPDEMLSRLIAHRIDRERRVERAVQEGASTPQEIVEQVYEKSLDGVRDLARKTVIAHLGKLAVEGRVEWVNGTARPA